ncbi:VWA domain-containing protein [Grimontia marina]|uniref:VWA domain containing CoxE-like protein n=1 Tax=Grimontia marina TaxID=646534 RepID=A0A128EZV9_9GAMM|nr:VWA domain-containing protein [Grimontia marina]CZF80067.1 VWA domain containing CoxE-like protein [Grimontia marina]
MAEIFDIEKTELRMIHFLRSLRARGFLVDFSTQQTALMLLAKNDFFDREAMRHLLKTLVCDTRAKWHQFDELYARYWSVKPIQGGKVITQNLMGKQNKSNGVPDGQSTQQRKEKSKQSQKESGAVDLENGDMINKYRASSRDGHVDRFDAPINPELLVQLSGICDAIINQWLRSRQATSSSAHVRKHLDIRQSVRVNMQHGGELFELQWFSSRDEKPTVTLFIDVSRSMDKHTSLFLLFAMAMVKRLKTTRVWLFNTQLTEISRQLHHQQFGQLREQILLQHLCWGGGTKIAASLDKWLHSASKPQRRNHYVVILSDGLDTDSGTQLSQVTKHLKRLCHRLIWVNPLMALERFDLSSQKLAGAMEYIDDMFSINTVEDFRKLTTSMH